MTSNKDKYVDLNDLAEASYNEMIRLKVMPSKNPRELTNDERASLGELLYDKIGDNLLDWAINYENYRPTSVQFKFDEMKMFKTLVLDFAMCYLNGMDLNEYFSLEIRDDKR